MRTPPGFVRTAPGALVRRGFEGEAPGWWSTGPDPAGASELPPDTGGRGSVRRVPLSTGGTAYVRRYRHGGLLRHLLGELYALWPPRAWRELAATEAARGAGIVAPEVLAAAALPIAPGVPLSLVHRGVLVTRALDGRRALSVALRAATDDGERRRWVQSAWREIRRLHDAGIRHPDTNVSNLLAGDDPAMGLAVIDFDRARALGHPVGAFHRALARRRLSRSVAKLALPGLDRAGTRAAIDATACGEER